MKVSFVILTWNSEKFIEKCLGSIKSGTGDPEHEVIVVDNGSTDRTLDLINEFFPSARVITNSRNRGVAPARNQGIAETTGEYIVILDIDTFLYPGAVSRIVEYMDENSSVGICAPRLTFEDGAVQESARRFPTVFSKILRRLGLKRARNRQAQEYYSLADVEQPMKVDYVIGACQVIRRQALDEVGLLDERIFYGPEDVDICLRMWEKGWRVMYFPKSTVVHYEQRITKAKPLSAISLLHAKGLVYFFLKHGYFFSARKVYKRINS